MSETTERYYTEEELTAMSIFQLRDTARKIGVASPTTKKKAELVREYMDISTGKEMPNRTSNRGRPPKKRVEPAEEEAQAKPVQKQEEKSKSFAKRETAAESQEQYRQDGDIQQEKHYASPEELLKNDDCERKSGVLDVLAEGYGFLRAENCEYGNKDAYVSAKLIRGMGLRAGDMVVGIAKKNAENRPPAIVSVETVNGNAPENLRQRPQFDNLIPIYPNERFKLERESARNDFAIRCIDLIAPIGKGQRAMIVSPPKAGKTTLLKKIAGAIADNYPNVMLFVLLVDERPEEVTDMQRSIRGEVIYSTFDEMPEHHCKAAELLIERAKRNVELGKDVVIIMDSLTRLARAYNLTIPPTGRTLSGGIDPGALHAPKRFFGSARNIENGGSLTIIATALIDTGSRMDDVIYEEFKGTGNMEIHLDRKLSERRIFPAIDLNRSSTRREDLLLSQKELEGVFAIRRMIAGDNADATEQLLNMLMRTKNNAEFVDNVLVHMKALEKQGFKYTGR